MQKQRSKSNLNNLKNVFCIGLFQLYIQMTVLPAVCTACELRKYRQYFRQTVYASADTVFLAHFRVLRISLKDIFLLLFQSIRISKGFQKRQNASKSVHKRLKYPWALHSPLMFNCIRNQPSADTLTLLCVCGWVRVRACVRVCACVPLPPTDCPVYMHDTVILQWPWETSVGFWLHLLWPWQSA